MSFCWSSFVSGGYNDNTDISKFVRNGANKERPLYDFKNHYLCFSPSCTKDIESILRGSHGEILTEKKIMRRATYSAERMKFDERRRHFGVSSSYDYKDWTYKNNQHNYSNYNHHYLDAMIDKPDDPILVDFTHYYYKEENPTFGLKCISLIKRQSNKDNKIYYVMVYSFLNFDVASMFLEELYQKKTFF